MKVGNYQLLLLAEKKHLYLTMYLPPLSHTYQEFSNMNQHVLLMCDWGSLIYHVVHRRGAALQQLPGDVCQPQM